MPAAAKIARALTVGLFLLAYFGYVFRIHTPAFRTHGLGDWIDPYFINYLLEHWYVAATNFRDPSSPPMFFPVRGTLGYSHGLILYAPFYVPIRLAVHPFQAYTLTLLTVITAGALCLYALLRRSLRLTFIEAVVLFAFFVTSPNVVNRTIGVWSQRASVFLIPVIALATYLALRPRHSSARFAGAALAGALATSLFTHDFYTAQFALFFVVAIGAGVLLFDENRARRSRVRDAWRTRDARHFGFAAGAITGAMFFLWVYVPAYLEHPRFAEADLLSRLRPVRPARWTTVAQAIDAFQWFASWRSFLLVLALGIFAVVLRARLPRDMRRLVYWFGAISLLVLVAPLTYRGFSPWRSLFEWIPGFSPIRDPTRIIFVYDLAVTAVAAIVIARMPARSPARIAAVVLVAALAAYDPATERLEYLRPRETFARIVEAPIGVDPACRSFFIRGASPEYMRRSENMWGLYGVDAMFVSSRLGLPTLNGFSAWSPPDWDLWNPHESDYPQRVQAWIARHQLTHVCEFDIERRRMVLLD